MPQPAELDVTTRTQRQNFFDRLVPALARRYADSLGLGYVGTIRKMPPPPSRARSSTPTDIS